MILSATSTAYLLLAIALLATAFAQIFFKHYHLSGRISSLVLALSLFIGLPPITYLAVRQLGLGKVYILTSLSYGLVAFLGWKFFGERVGRNQLQGLILVTLGCLVYSI